MSPVRRCDVAIVGFGPTGAVMAGLLASSELDVVVIERRAHAFDKPRAIGLFDEVMRVFQHIGVAEQIEPLTLRYPGTLYLGVDGEPIKFISQQEPPYPLGWTVNASFIQPEMEGVLHRHARSLANVELLTGHDVVSIAEEGNGDGRLSLCIVDVSAHARMEVSARYLLGCDGARSSVRAAFGMPLQDLAFDEEWAVVDAWVHDAAALPSSGRQYCFPSRPATYVIGPRNLRRWEIKLLPGETAADFRSSESIARLLAPLVDVTQIDIWRHAVYRFHALVAERWRHDRVFIVGDAAHQTPPFMGQGMCSGIRDAANLSWKIQMVEEGLADASLLDTYEAELKPHVTELIEVTTGLGLIIGELDEVKARKRDAALRAQQAGIQPTERASLIPPLRHGLIDSHAVAKAAVKPAAGTLFLQPWVRNAEHPEYLRLDDLLGPPRRFVLVTRGIEPQAWAGAAELAAWGSILGQRVAIVDNGRQSDEDAVLCVQERDGLFQRWTERFGACAVVVRPDRYVYGVAADAAGLRRLLHQLLAALWPSNDSTHSHHPGHSIPKDTR